MNDMTERREDVRAALVGSGLLAQNLAQWAPGVGVKIVGAATSDPQKCGTEISTVLERVTSGTFQTLEEVLSRTDVEVLLHAGPAGSSLWDVFERAAAVGLDTITSAGLFDGCSDPVTSERARALDAVARTSGARLLGTGMFPGFLADAIPLLMANIIPDPVTVQVRHTSDIATWSSSVLANEIGVGKPVEERSSSLLGYLEASARVVADGLGLSVDKWHGSSEPTPAAAMATVGDIAVPAGATEGFHYRATGMVAGEPRITIDWLSGSPDNDLGTHCALLGPGDLKAVVRIAPVSGYAATATRLLRSIRPLQTLKGGLHTIADLPLSAERSRSAS